MRAIAPKSQKMSQISYNLLKDRLGITDLGRQTVNNMSEPA